ncbi:hypothetical protein Btru_059734 [Bulinus truncatus]|nr:hypothetical protein Btru_059734 [Bulinus truncatus]
MTDESMRWLCAGKHYTQMEELILKIAKVNNVNSQKAIDLFKAKLCCNKEENIVYLSNSNAAIPELKKIVGNHPDIHLSVILRNKYVLHTLLVSNCIWFVDSLAYNGLLMIAPDLHEDFYVGFVIGVLSGLPASIIFCLLIKRIGRKKCTAMFHLLAGIFLVIYAILLNRTIFAQTHLVYWISVMFSILGRSSLSVGFSSTLLYIPELFPTSIRYRSLIPDTADTTTSINTDCAYDRVIVEGNSDVVADSTKVYRYDTSLGINASTTSAISDHYPVDFRLN